MKNSEKPQKSQTGGKGQRPLTSFFYTKTKEKPSHQLDTGVCEQPAKSGAAARPHADVSCAVVSLVDSPEKSSQKASAYFSEAVGKAAHNEPVERPAKRARTGGPNSSTISAGVQNPKNTVVCHKDVATLAEACGQVQPDASLREGIRIPGRVDRMHERFQNKLVRGWNGQRGATAEEVIKQKYTPLELQVVDLKKKYPGVILIIEVGYKFRFFGEDAEIASKETNIFAYPDRNFMTASVPVPRLHVYVRRLVAAGYKVGIVRQTETAALKAAGDNKYTPFTRKLTAMYTRSTLEAGDKEDVGDAQGADGGLRINSGSWSSEGLSNYLVCLVEAEGPTQTDDVEIGVVAVETSTGHVLFDQFRDGMMRGNLEARLMYAAPSELLVTPPTSAATRRLLGSFSQSVRGLKAEAVQGFKYDLDSAMAAITAFYSSAADTGVAEQAEGLPPLVVQALAHALHYLKQFSLEAVLRQSCAFRPFHEATEITLSPNALRQLEVLRNNDDGGERGSLLWLLDHTRTAMGGRLMRTWTAHPLRSVPAINDRLDAVQEIAAAADDESSMLGGLRGGLGRLPDLERGITRILHRTASPAELLVTLRAFSTLAADLRIKVGEGGVVKGARSPLLQRLLASAAAAEAGDSAREMLSLIYPEAAESNDKVGLFKSEEHFPEVFEHRAAVAQCEALLSGYLPKLAKRLRIPRLEYRSVQNQGDFLIEVDADRTDIPKDWEKISGTKKVNRYRPPEVREAMRELEMAKERLQACTEQAYQAFLCSFAGLYMPFRSAASALAALDALQSLALVAGNAGYVRPEFVDSAEPAQLHITAGRHPVLDALMNTAFVPNDTHLGASASQQDCEGPSALAQLITGPNMGGKSAYLRQVALIAIMAQVGSLVPAKAIRMRAIDAVHTRMGANDNLAQGRSTFLEELSETSSILATATGSSLVVIDELGRGTSTHDGLAIAYATLHHLVQQLKSLTLFVTHYPKVATLQERFPGQIEARYMSYLQEVPVGSTTPSAAKLPLVQQTSTASSGPAAALPKITFLYRLVPGVADRSFGLNVARMARLPDSLVDRAAVMAERMEEESLNKQLARPDGASAERLAVRVTRAIATCGTGEGGELQALQKEVSRALGCLTGT